MKIIWIVFNINVKEQNGYDTEIIGQSTLISHINLHAT